MLLTFLLACVSDTEPQIEPDFLDRLGRGFACTETPEGPTTTHGLATNSSRSLRVEFGQDDLLVMVGSRLGNDLDANNCDDDEPSPLIAPSVVMAYTLTSGTVTPEEQTDGRWFHLADVVLTPAPELAEDSDPAVTVEGVEVTEASVGPIPYGGLPQLF